MDWLRRHAVRSVHPLNLASSSSFMLPVPIHPFFVFFPPLNVIVVRGRREEGEEEEGREDN